MRTAARNDSERLLRDGKHASGEEKRKDPGPSFRGKKNKVPPSCILSSLSSSCLNVRLQCRLVRLEPKKQRKNISSIARMRVTKTPNPNTPLRRELGLGEWGHRSDWSMAHPKKTQPVRIMVKAKEP